MMNYFVQAAFDNEIDKIAAVKAHKPSVNEVEGAQTAGFKHGIAGVSKMKRPGSIERPTYTKRQIMRYMRSRRHKANPGGAPINWGAGSNPSWGVLRPQKQKSRRK